MDKIIIDIKSHFKNKPKQTGLITADVRSFSSKAFKSIKDKDPAGIFYLCEKLLKERKGIYNVIAYDWAFRIRKQYDESTFNIFENWLFKYVSGWGDCDDFCTHAFGYLLMCKNKYFSRVIDWTGHEKFSVRRAAAVVLIYPIRHAEKIAFDPFEISDRLMNDSHYLVQKGYGWMLKVLSVKRPDQVFKYLMKNEKNMTRTAFRYALEKLDKEKKDILMKGDNNIIT